MKLCFLWLMLLLISFVPVSAQNAIIAEDRESAYTRTITARAQKIVNALQIADTDKATRLTTIIAGQYRTLNGIHTKRDEQIKLLKASGEEKDVIVSRIKTTEDEANNKLEKLHEAYLLKLSAELTQAQVEQVKDGMTYGVLPITYNGYLDMLPRLTAEQKDQIRKWLEEAREHAMDAESSEKKHWWFGKYKGRINNYLSAAGYDLKKESEEWHKRVKAREAEKKNAGN